MSLSHTVISPLNRKTRSIEKGDQTRFKQCDRTATVFSLQLSLLSFALPALPLLSPLFSADNPECGGHCGELTSLFIIQIPIQY